VTLLWNVEPENHVLIKKKDMKDVINDIKAFMRMKVIKEKLGAIESQVQTSLESLLNKMKKRMTLMKKKVDKLDKLATSLALIVKKLVDKVRLNLSDS
jgi:hypothetical protein